MTTHTDASPRAGLREWLGLAVLALPTLLISIDVSILHLAAPHIVADLSLNSSQMLWTVDIYGFLLAGFLVTMGVLGDRLGRRRLLLLGGAGFGAVSLLAAYSSSPEMLIAARALLGVFAATLMPSTLALIMSMFADEKQRGMAIGVWVTMFSAGIAIGPVVGGALLSQFWWGSVFLIAVPVVAVLLAAGPRLLPEYKDADAPRLDLLSVATFVGGTIALVYGLKTLALDGAGLTGQLSLVAAVAALIVFVVRQRALSTPMLNLSLLRSRNVAGCLMVLLTGMVIAGGTYLFFTQYLQLVHGMSPLQAGLWLLPSAALLTLTSMAAAVLAARFRPGRVVAVGLAVSLAGYLLMATASADTLTQAIIGFTLAYGGGGPMVALGTDMVMGSAPPEQAGAASSLSETSTELGMALGVAVLGSLGTYVYRANLPAPITGQPQLADAAHDGLANLLAVAQHIHATYVDVARAAFTQGFNAIATTSAVVTAALIGVCLWVLRPVEPTAEVEHAQQDECVAVREAVQVN